MMCVLQSQLGSLLEGIVQVCRAVHGFPQTMLTPCSGRRSGGLRTRIFLRWYTDASFRRTKTPCGAAFSHLNPFHTVHTSQSWILFVTSFLFAILVPHPPGVQT